MTCFPAQPVLIAHDSYAQPSIALQSGLVKNQAPTTGGDMTPGTGDLLQPLLLQRPKTGLDMTPEAPS